MSNKIAMRSFAVSTVEAVADLINPGRYNGTIEGAKIVEMPDGSERLWVGVRLDNKRYVTTLCSLVASAKSAYKTAALAVAAQSHLAVKQAGIPENVELLIGTELVADVTIWQPSNGTAVNDIRTFIAK